MKQAMKIRGLSFLLALGFAMFFTAGTANAQAQQQARDCTRFTQCDLNGDGYIAQNEFRNGSFADFDKNGDGQLSRKEYRKMNQSQKAYKGSNGQGQGQGKGQQKGFHQGNGQRTGTMMQGGSRTGTRRGRGQ